MPLCLSMCFPGLFHFIPKSTPNEKCLLWHGKRPEKEGAKGERKEEKKARPPPCPPMAKNGMRKSQRHMRKFRKTPSERVCFSEGVICVRAYSFCLVNSKFYQQITIPFHFPLRYGKRSIVQTVIHDICIFQ